MTQTTKNEKDNLREEIWNNIRGYHKYFNYDQLSKKYNVETLLAWVHPSDRKDFLERLNQE